MSEEVQKHIDTIRSQFCESYQQASDLRGITSETQLQSSDELTELKKLAQINRAHATKIGIVCQPQRFYDNLSALSKELQEFTASLFYILSLLPLFYQDKKDRWAPFFLQSLDSKILELLSGSSVLCNDIDAMLKDDQREKEDRDRLRSIGMIWAACDSLHELAQRGQFHLLGDAVHQSCALVQDVLQDIEQWIADPELGNDFDLGDLEGSDDEKDESGSDGDGGNDEVALQKMKDFVQGWQNNIKMIKLLLSSFAKSISTNFYNDRKTKGSILQKLYDLQKDVVAQIDELLSDFFMSDASFDPTEFESTIKRLNELLTQMVRIIRNLNKDDAKKSKWIDVWDNKYFAN